MYLDVHSIPHPPGVSKSKETQVSDTVEPIDLMECDAAELLDAARRHGVHHFLPPVASLRFPAGRLMVWNCRNPEGQRIVEAMRARRAELASWIAAHRPALPVIPDEELRYRRDVLHEPDDDLPVSEMSAGMLRAYIVCVVHEELEHKGAAAEWERDIAARDAMLTKRAPAHAVAPPARHQTRRRSVVPSDRVRF